jgi:hypothetical protein
MFNWLKNCCLFKKECKKEMAKPSRDLINYGLNDPTTPGLVIDIPVPKKPNVLAFTVNGFNPSKLGSIDTPEGQAANVYATMAYSLNQFIEHRDIKTWAATRNLKVIPRAGQDLNAYYDRRHLKFFHSPDPKTKKMIYMADSVDVVAHELGHALLDAIRKDLWSTQSLESWAFHEAFGDINAIATVTQHTPMIEYALHETNGNMRKDNVISRLAEEMGNTIYHITKGRGGYKPGALRNAVNKFKYTPPEKLPYNTPNNKLGGEPHSFGRLFVGAWYDVVVSIYEKLVGENVNKIDAFRRAVNTSYRYLSRGLRIAPNTPRFYNAVAQAMLTMDRLEGGFCQKEIAKAFRKRRILLRSVSMLSSEEDIKKMMDASSDIVNNDRGCAIRVQETRKIRVCDHVKSASNNPLFNLEIEVPADSYCDLNSQGHLLQSISSSESDSLDSAIACLNYLHSEDKVGNDREFIIEDGKLVRSHIVCCHKEI